MKKMLPSGAINFLYPLIRDPLSSAYVHKHEMEGNDFTAPD